MTASRSSRTSPQSSAVPAKRLRNSQPKALPASARTLAETDPYLVSRCRRRSPDEHASGGVTAERIKLAPSSPGRPLHRRPNTHELETAALAWSSSTGRRVLHPCRLGILGGAATALLRTEPGNRRCRGIAFGLPRARSPAFGDISYPGAGHARELAVGGHGSTPWLPGRISPRRMSAGPGHWSGLDDREAQR